MNDKGRSTYADFPTWELVRALKDHAQVGSQLHSETQGALQARLFTDLVASIDRHEKAASRLSRQVLALNIVLGVFTVAGTVLTIIAFMH